MADTILIPKDTPDWQSLLSDVEDSVSDAEKYSLATSQFTDTSGNTYEKGAKGWAEDAKNAFKDKASNDDNEDLFVFTDEHGIRTAVQSLNGSFYLTQEGNKPKENPSVQKRIPNFDNSDDILRLFDANGNVITRMESDGGIRVPGITSSTLQQKIKDANPNTPVEIPSYKKSGSIIESLRILESKGGGILQLEEGQYDIYQTIFVPPNVTIQGCGPYNTSFVVRDGAEFIDFGINNKLFPIFIGKDITTFSDNVVVRDLSIDGRNTSFSDRVFGVGCQYDRSNRFPNSQIQEFCKDITIQNVHVFDAHIGIGASKTGAWQDYNKDRQYNFKNWNVLNCHVEKTQNKAIEFQEMTGGTVAFNDVRNASSGIQFIHEVEESKIIGNSIDFGANGIMPGSHNSDSIVCSNNTVREVPSNISNRGIKSCITIKTDTLHGNLSFYPTQKDIIISGNFLDGNGNAEILSFKTNQTGGEVYWRDIKFNSNIGVGGNYDLTLKNNKPPTWVFEDIDFRNESIVGFNIENQSEIKDIVLQSSRIENSISIPSSPSDIAIVGNRVPSITDNGNNTVQNNF